MPSSFTDMTALRVACDNSCLHWRSSAPSVSTSSACTKEWIPQLPTVASYSESSLRSPSLSGNSSATASARDWLRRGPRVSALAVRECRWTRSGLGSSGIRAVLGHRSRPTPGSAKARHKGRWLDCPKPLLQPSSQVLDLPYSASADSHCPKPPGCGQLPFFSAGKPVSGEHEQAAPQRDCDDKSQRPNLSAVRVRYEEQKTRSPRGARRPQRIETEDLGVVHHSSSEAERLPLM